MKSNIKKEKKMIFVWWFCQCNLTKLLMESETEYPLLIPFLCLSVPSLLAAWTLSILSASTLGMLSTASRTSSWRSILMEMRSLLAWWAWIGPTWSSTGWRCAGLPGPLLRAALPAPSKVCPMGPFVRAEKVVLPFPGQEMWVNKRWSHVEDHDFFPSWGQRS